MNSEYSTFQIEPFKMFHAFVALFGLVYNRLSMFLVWIYIEFVGIKIETVSPFCLFYSVFEYVNNFKYFSNANIDFCYGDELVYIYCLYRSNGFKVYKFIIHFVI